jgi:hypothetical protein
MLHVPGALARILLDLALLLPAFRTGRLVHLLVSNSRTYRATGLDSRRDADVYPCRRRGDNRRRATLPAGIATGRISMMLRPSIASLAALLLVAFAGCASNGIQTSTSFDPLTTFPSQATFVWDDAANRLPADERIAQLDLDPMIRQAAEEAFAARGYRRVASEPADYRLSYEIGENRWHGPEGTTSVVSISLQLADATSRRRVWLGFGRAEVQQGLTRDERARRLRSAFDELLASFPPSAPKR